jgi:glycosyltransferase involved in cell wall biosynthesis
MRVFICGYFGYDPEQNDGQTIKTRMVRNVFESITDVQVTWFDTQKIKFNYLFSYFSIVNQAVKSDRIVMLPGKNGLFFIFPLLYLISILKNSKVIYIVIGGWLPIVTNKSFIISWLLRKIDKIMVETQTMKKDLEIQKFKNISVLNNFRPLVDLPQEQPTSEEITFKVVFVSRILKEKGIYELIKAVDILSEKLDICCDFYGPLDPEDKEAFLSQIDNSKKCEYRGVLEPNKVVSEIQRYDLFVFPTYYHGEGFPGVLIDAMNAGIPVLASNWRYNPDIIKDSFNGFLYQYNNFDQLVEKIRFCAHNRGLLHNMKQNCLSESKKYDMNYAKNEIFRTIYAVSYN